MTPEHSQESAIVAVFDTHRAAEEAVKELQRSGFDMKKLSIVGKGYYTEEYPVGFYTTGDRIKYWGGSGALWGGLWGMLFGAAVFWVPGIGPLAIGGPLVAILVGALEGAAIVGGISALGAALASIGMSKESIIRFETAIKADKFVVIAHGTAAEVAKARQIIERAKASAVEVLSNAAQHPTLSIARQIASVGLLIWVDPRSRLQERVAMGALRKADGRDVHIREIARRWGGDSVPFHDA